MFVVILTEEKSFLREMKAILSIGLENLNYDDCITRLGKILY